MYSSTISAADLQAQKRRQDECVNGALLEGAKSAALAGTVSGGLSLGLKHVSEAYRCGCGNAVVIRGGLLPPRPGSAGLC
jgi:hypothetical protein